MEANQEKGKNKENLVVRAGGAHCPPAGLRRLGGRAGLWMAVALVCFLAAVATPVAAVQIWTETFDNTNAWTAIGTANKHSISSGTAYGPTTGSTYYMYRKADGVNATRRPFYTCWLTGSARETKWGYSGTCNLFYRSMMKLFGHTTWGPADNSSTQGIGYNSASAYGNFYRQDATTFNSLGLRNEASTCGGDTWLDFRINVNASTVDYYAYNSTATDRTATGIARNAISQQFGITEVRLGFSASVNGVIYWDNITLNANAPATPTSPTATANSTTQITWGATPAGSDYWGFEIFDGSTSKYVSSTTSRTTTFSWAEGSLSPNTQYTRTLKAYNGTLWSAAGATSSRYTLQNTPTTPTFSSVTASGFRVSTTGPVNLTSGGSGVIFHNGAADRAKVTVLHDDVTGLTANTEYTFKVKGVNGDGVATAYSATASQWTLSKAPAAGSVTADNAAPCSSLGQKVNWTANDGFGPGGVAKYKYVWDQSATHTWDETEADWTTGTLQTDPVGGGVWYLHVKGYNGAGVANGTYDYIVSAVAGPPQNAPTDGTPAANSTSSITWKWNDLSDESGYRVKDSGGADKSGDLAANTIEWTEAGFATPNAQYTRYIYAFNGCGEGTASAGQSKYTLAKAGIDGNGDGSTGNVWCMNGEVNLEYSPGTTLTFSNPAGFGTSTHGGSAWKASAFEYKWTNSATETWASAGTAWTSGSITPAFSAEGNYYLHVRAKNADGDWNNTECVHYGPFKCGRVTIFTEGFDGASSLDNWTQQLTSYDYSTAHNHGTYTGAGAAHMDYVAYPGGSRDQEYRNFYRIYDGSVEKGNGYGGVNDYGTSYPLPFGEGIVSGYFYDPLDAHKIWEDGHSCTRFRQALSLRNQFFPAAMFIDNGYYYGNWTAPPDPAEDFGQQRYYAHRLIGMDGHDYEPWGALRYDHDPTHEEREGVTCATAPVGVTGWIWFQTQIIPDTATYDHSQSATTTFNLWRKDELHDGANQTISSHPGTTDFWLYGYERVTLGLGAYSEDSEGWWDDIRLQAYRPGNPDIAPAQANSKTSITWYWTNTNVGNNIFAYDLADPDGCNKAPVYPMGQPGDGLLDGESDEWIQRWQTQYTEVNLTPNAPYKRKVHAWNGTLNSKYTELSHQTRLQDNTIVGRGYTDPAWRDEWTYPWAQAGIDTDGTGQHGNVWCTNHTPGSGNWKGAHPTHSPFKFTNPAVFGESVHGGSWWKATEFQYVWDKNPTLAWPAAGATTWKTGDIEPVCPSDGAWYLHVRARNRNGEWNNVDVVNYGPFLYDRLPPIPGEIYSTSVGFDGNSYINFNAAVEDTYYGAGNYSGMHPTGPYKAARPERSGWDSGWLAPTVKAPNWLQISDTRNDLLAGDVASYTLKMRDLAGNESTGAITARIPIDPASATNAWVYTGYGAALAPPGIWPDWNTQQTKVFSGFNYSLLTGTPRVHGFTSNDGQMLWVPMATAGSVQGRVPAAPFGSPSVLKAFAGSQDAYVYCINGDTGAKVWEHNMGSGYRVSKSVAAQYNVAVTVPGKEGTYDLIFAVSRNNGDQTGNFLRALNAVDGALVWQFTPGNLDAICGGPAVVPAQNTVYFTSMAGSGDLQPSLWAVDTRTGLVKWSWALGDISGSVSARPDGSVIYAATDDGDVYAFYPTGVPKWQDGSGNPVPVNLGYSIYGAAAYHSGKLYVATNDNKVWRVTDGASAGSVDSSWGGSGYVSITAASQPVPAPYPIPAVYVGSGDGNLYELNMSDGSQRAHKAIGFTVGDPTIDVARNPNLIYAGTSDGRVYAFTLPFPLP